MRKIVSVAAWFALSLAAFFAANVFALKGNGTEMIGLIILSLLCLAVASILAFLK